MEPRRRWIVTTKIANTFLKMALALAVLAFLALNTAAALHAQTPTTQTTVVTTSDGPARLAGGTAIPGSIALLVSVGDTTPSVVINMLGLQGCSTETLGIVENGNWRMYVNGAPESVNATFPVGFS